MGWAWTYAGGVVVASVLIRWDARRTRIDYDPVAAFIACLLWPGGLVLFLAHLLGSLVMWALRLNGRAE